MPAHLIRKIAVEAPADPRSVRKLLAGQAVSPMTAERILRALEAHGLAYMAPEDDSAMRREANVGRP